MKKKIFVLIAAIAIIFLFGGYYFQYNALNADGKPDKKVCPFLQSNTNNSCPYLNEKSEHSNSNCPYLNGEMKCPSNDKGFKSEACPYLKQNGNAKKNFRTIKRTST
jgi:hypothetical protein